MAQALIHRCQWLALVVLAVLLGTAVSLDTAVSIDTAVQVQAQAQVDIAVAEQVLFVVADTHLQTQANLTV